MGLNLEKVALILGVLAFQLHILSMAMSDFRSQLLKSRDDATQVYFISNTVRAWPVITIFFLHVQCMSTFMCMYANLCSYN